jgi:hypothetical protein
MTSQFSKNRHGWRRAVMSGALAAGLLMGFGSGTANADVLDDIGVKYMQGAGGGQISNFAKEALTLRALGFKPSKANMDALQAGWDYLPNQSRLVDALKETVAFQRKLQAQQQNARPQQQFNIGGAPPSQGPPGVPPQQQPGGINIPIPVG